MALSFFEPKEQSGNGEKPFLNEWLEANPKNKKQQFLITEVIRVKSGKGYLVITDEFSCFIWKNQALSKAFISALEFWTENPDKGYPCYVFLKNPTKQEFTLAADKDQETTWFVSKNGFTTTESDANSQDSVVEDGNPFL